MTAAVVRLPGRLVLAVSVYVPREDAQALRETCDSLRRAVREVRRDTGTVGEVVIAEYFNPHDQLWGEKTFLWRNRAKAIGLLF
jgi:hypothetical protein